MTNANSDQWSEQFFCAIDFHRGLVLDAVETEVGDRPSWPHLRSRLLKTLGDRGLEGRIRQLLNLRENKKNIG